MDSCLRWQRTNERTTKFNNKTKDGKGYTNIYVCIKEKLSTCMWLLFLLLLHSKKSVRSDGDGTGNDGNDDNFFSLAACCWWGWCYVVVYVCIHIDVVMMMYALGAWLTRVCDCLSFGLSVCRLNKCVCMYG